MSDISNLNEDDAKEVLKYLEQMFKKNDLSDVHESAITKLMQKEFNQNENRIPSSKLLMIYLSESIKILNSRSSHHYYPIIKKLNENIRCKNNGPILGIKLQLSPVEADLTGLNEIDLKELPDYSPLIFGLSEILGDFNYRG